jgi:hypothetical protein
LSVELGDQSAPLNLAYTSNGDFELSGGPGGGGQGKAVFLMNAGTSIVAASRGVVISSGGGAGEAELRIADGTNSVAALTQNHAQVSAGYVIVTEKGEINVGDGSSLMISGAPILIGKYEGALYGMDPQSLPPLPSGKGLAEGGRLRVGAGSALEASGSMYIGKGAEVNFEPGSRLELTGALNVAGGDSVFRDVSTSGGGIRFYGGHVEVFGDISAPQWIGYEGDLDFYLAPGSTVTSGGSGIHSVDGTSPKVVMGAGAAVSSGASSSGRLEIGGSLGGPQPAAPSAPVHFHV